MRNSNHKATSSKKGRIVALALAGVLALGGAGAICMTTIGRSPGQPAAVTQTAKTDATKKAVTKNNTNQAATKANTKQAETKSNTKQAQPAANDAKPQPQQQQQSNQQQQQQQQNAQPAPVKAENNGMQANYTADQCIAAACNYVGAGGAAKGPALNVRCSNLIDGGGTLYYNVELDLGDVHYQVMVEAIGGKVVSGTATHMGVQSLLNDDGSIIEGTGTPVDA